MATGDLKQLYPPGNKGTTQGVGMIDGHDGNKYVFQTPNDNGGKELVLGSISFNIVNGRFIDSVTQSADNPLGEA
ncbi:MAG: hypothetical protein COW67_05255 [Flavobacteriales bacterium CG18_big_fil_WC_8_21_14_2_50_32_9]|nr:hypothetical protein [Flavobacteriales bacterium]PIQ16009.1 MAG: hypothetical protein COW67_05255 [Flavobacteriales bacterium CG18_big_fil_WC_8_21_14_2_50_32_9]PJC61673.1 MAG: hypothetical protein CO022_08570 [Flavobacteriales bacterium CG_4_9_14_0_2_um_filter_32_27]